MPAILKDRFIVTLLLLIIISLAACFSFYVWQLQGSIHAPEAPVSIGQNDSQAISVALNDTAVEGKMEQAWFTMDMAGNGTPGDDTPDLHLGGVTMSSFQGADIVSPAMPAVEIDIGEISDAGINMYAFVDLQKGRVAYIGFSPRPGNNAYGIEYSAIDHGVSERTISTDSTSFMDNVTIVDTGYSGNRELTDQDKSDIIAFALDNASIKGRLDGSRYETLVMMAGQEDRYHIISYPVVRFTVYKKDSDGVDFYLFAAEDPVNKRISTTEASTPDVQPPQFPVS